MNFLLTFPTTCAAVYLLRKPIKRWPVVFYLCAIALDTLYLASGSLSSPAGCGESWWNSYNDASLLWHSSPSSCS